VRIYYYYFNSYKIFFHYDIQIRLDICKESDACCWGVSENPDKIPEHKRRI
jgi:hypothetical protein